MTKTVHQLLMSFALLIFAAQSFASSAMVCVMVSGAAAAPITKTSPSAAKVKAKIHHAKTEGAKKPCHEQPHHKAAKPASDAEPKVEQTALSKPAPTSHDCFYCAHQLCGNGACSVHFAASGLRVLTIDPVLIQAIPQAQHLTSPPRRTLYRPPICA
ncbi:MAG TPA: hypothetical protein VIC26_09190 [Marinagarivorans sp.]